MAVRKCNVFHLNKSQGSVLFRPDFRHLSVKKFKPEMSVRTSLAKYEIQEGLFNLPLYAIGALRSLLDWDKMPVTAEDGMRETLRSFGR